LYQIVVDLATSLGTAAVIILVVMALAYRSLRIGLITVVPNMFPLAVTATFLALTGRPLDIASVCSFTVCLGIAVDDSIHFLTRYQEELSEAADPAEAVQRAFVGVGTALIMTTLVLIAGFGTVLTSDLPGHRTFAIMACWTIGAALVGDLIFLPALLLCFGPRPRQQPEGWLERPERTNPNDNTTKSASRTDRV
jgi:predicted RND superfamily exporter protein